MKTEIKTVYCRAENNGYFDEEVNGLLEDGWKLGRIELKKANTENKYSMLFALLFKQTII